MILKGRMNKPRANKNYTKSTVRSLQEVEPLQITQAHKTWKRESLILIDSDTTMGI